MGKFENGKYVCIIKWCFRRTKMRMDEWTELKGSEWINGRYTHTHSIVEIEREREQTKWNPCMSEGERGTRSFHAGGIEANEPSPEGSGRFKQLLLLLLLHMSHVKTPSSWGGQEKREKKENRKIIIYIYILFSFMYAWNCKNGESYCPPLVLSFFHIYSIYPYIMYSGGQEEHTSTYTRTHAHTLNTVPHFGHTLHIHIFEMFAFMKNNLIEKILLHKKTWCCSFSHLSFPFSFFSKIFFSTLLSLPFGSYLNNEEENFYCKFSHGDRFLLRFFSVQKRRNQIKVQTNAAIQYASPFLINKMYEKKNYIWFFTFYFLLTKWRTKPKKAQKYIKFHHHHHSIASSTSKPFIRVYIPKWTKTGDHKRIERKFDCNSKRYNKFSQTVSFSPALCMDGHIEKLLQFHL